MSARLTRRLPARGRRLDQRGASLVEFALILPIFSLLLFGMVDFGLVFGGFISIENQVNSAGRAISTGQIPPSCSTAAGPALCTAESYITSSLGIVPGSLKVAISYPNGAVAGQPLIVCAQAALKSTTGITSLILNGRTENARSELLQEVSPNEGTVTTNTAGYSC